MDKAEAGQWASVTSLSRAEIGPFLQLCSFGDVSLKAMRIVVFDYDPTQLAADQERRAKRLAEKPYSGGIGAVDRRHLEVTRTELVEQPIEYSVIADVPPDHEFWQTGTLGRTSDTDQRCRVLYRDIRYWTSADSKTNGVELSNPSQRTPIIQPSNDDFKTWAKGWYDKRRKEGLSLDWSRAGLAALRAEFPHVKFKTGDALAIARDAGLARRYNK